MEPNTEDIEKQLEEKLNPIQKAISAMEASLSKKAQEIILLNYAYGSLIQQFEILKAEKNQKPHLVFQIQKKIPPKDNKVNECLKQIKGEKLFNFCDAFSLINIRQVCKLWDWEASQNLYDRYHNYFSANEELITKANEERNSMANAMLPIFQGIDKRDMNEVRAMRIVPQVVNEAIIVLFMISGEKITKEDLESNNVLTTKVRDSNVFFNMMMGISEKNLSLTTIQNVKKYLEEHSDLNFEKLNRCSNFASALFNMVINKLKWEDYLIDRFGKDRIFMLKGWEKFYEALKNKKI